MHLFIYVSSHNIVILTTFIVAPLLQSFIPGAVLALARWGATIPAGGAGGHNMQLN